MVWREGRESGSGAAVKVRAVASALWPVLAGGTVGFYLLLLRLPKDCMRASATAREACSTGKRYAVKGYGKVPASTLWCTG